MATLNFPNTTGQPTDGSFTYTDNNVIYSWNGTYWSANNATDLDNRYVNANGDTMTGDLTVPNLESAGDIQSTSQNGGQLAGFRNVIQNGGFRIWQRNPLGSLTTIGTDIEYLGPDRWSFLGVSTGVVRFSRNDASNGLKTINFNVAGTTNPVAMQQYIEAQNLVYGQQYTFSFYSTADFPSAALTSYDSVDASKDLNPSADKWSATPLGDDRWSVTFTYTTANGAMNSPAERGLNCYLGCNGLTYPSDGNYQFWNVQLEPGPVATPFEHRPIGTELALCQRYYWNFSYSVNGDLMYFTQYIASGRIVNIQHPVPMRTTPTVVSVVSSGQAIYNSTGSEKNWLLVINTPSSDTTGYYLAEWTADAEL